jgi:hypothetical protein
VELTESLLDKLLGALPVGDDVCADWEQRAERMREIAAPDLVPAMIAEEGGLQQEFHGADGYRDAWADWLAAFDSYRVEVEAVHQTPDGLIALTRQWVTPKGTAAAIEGKGAAVIWFPGERLERIEFHLDEATAFRAAGLDPQSLQE